MPKKRHDSSGSEDEERTNRVQREESDSDSSSSSGGIFYSILIFVYIHKIYSFFLYQVVQVHRPIRTRLRTKKDILCVCGPTLLCVLNINFK